MAAQASSFDAGSAATAAQAAQLGYPYEGNGTLTDVTYSSIDFSSLTSSTLFLPQSTLYITYPKLEQSRTYQWSATAEQRLGIDNTFSVSYVANKGNKLISTVAAYSQYGLSHIYFTNTLISNSYGSFQIVTNDAESNYQSLQM